MGPGRTGVKGVIRDRKEAEAVQRHRRADEVKELNRKMEKASLTGRTWAEDERERLEEKAREERVSVAELLGKGEEEKYTRARGKFGHLREVGLAGYVQAVENEDRQVWVVVHIYDPVSLVDLTSFAFADFCVVAGPMRHTGRHSIPSCSSASSNEVHSRSRWSYWIRLFPTLRIIPFVLPARPQTTLQTHTHAFTQDPRARTIPNRR